MRGKFIALVLLQVLFLLGMAGYKAFWSARGPTVVLRAVPVDPRDFFRGDYVVLRYEISDIDLARVPSSGSRFTRNDTVYVGLDRNADGTWRCASVGEGRPAGRPSLRGKVVSRSGSRMALEYGIESYFVEEGRGKVIEAARNSRDLTAEVAVGPGGQGIVKTLRANGVIVR